MKLNAACILFALLTGACTTIEPDLDALGVRVSGGATLSRMDGELTHEGETARDSTDGEGLRGRIELNRTSELGPTVGMFVEGGGIDYDASDPTTQRNLGGGILVRQLLLEGGIRPFIEARLGYRYTRLDVGVESADDGGILIGAGLGLEFTHSPGVSTFLQIDYDFAQAVVQGLDVNTHGPALMVGGEFRF